MKINSYTQQYLLFLYAFSSFMSMSEPLSPNNINTSFVTKANNLYIMQYDNAWCRILRSHSTEGQSAEHRGQYYIPL